MLLSWALSVTWTLKLLSPLILTTHRHTFNLLKLTRWKLKSLCSFWIDLAQCGENLSVWPKSLWSCLSNRFLKGPCSMLSHLGLVFRQFLINLLSTRIRMLNRLWQFYRNLMLILEGLKSTPLLNLCLRIQLLHSKSMFIWSLMGVSQMNKKLSTWYWLITKLIVFIQ